MSCADSVTVARWNEWAERQNMCLLFVWTLFNGIDFTYSFCFNSTPLDNNLYTNIHTYTCTCVCTCMYVARCFVCVCVGVSTYGIVFSSVSELVGQFWPRSLVLYPEICWC